MHLLLVTHNINRGDGQGRVNLEIARHALAGGHQVTLVAGRVDPVLLEAGGHWVQTRERFRRPGLLRFWHFVQMANARVRRLRDSVDVIVGNGYALTQPHHVNICHFVHSASAGRRGAGEDRRGFRGCYRRLDSSLNARRERRAFDVAGVVVAVSDQVRGELIHAGVPPGKIRRIHHGVDLEEFHPGSHDRQALGLPPSGPLALFVGDIRTFRKNLDTVLKAMQTTPQVQLAVVGAARRSPFPAMAKRLGVESRVHFMGFRRDVADIMRACDFLVFPTRQEPFGLVILEAMASGLPVVTTRQAGAAEVMPEGCGVLLDDPEDADALAGAMTRFSDPLECRRAGAQAFQVASRLSWSVMARQYLSLFEELHQLRSSATIASRRIAGRPVALAHKDV
jgi:glycosyltransferase involved in cell wall biosynthesis